MKLENVFVGHTKDGKEHVLLRRTGYIDLDNTYTYYIDLEAKMPLENGTVDLGSLVPYIEDLGIEKSRMSRRKIVKVYQADRATLVMVSSVFYGNLIERESNSNPRYYMEKTINQNGLYSRVYDFYENARDLRTSKIYSKKENVLSGLAVEEVAPIFHEQFRSPVQTKRKLLEMDYRKEL